MEKKYKKIYSGISGTNCAGHWDEFQEAHELEARGFIVEGERAVYRNGNPYSDIIYRSVGM